MMEILLKEMRSNQEKSDAGLLSMQEKTKADQAKAVARHEQIRTNQTRVEIGHKELLAKLEADREANMKAWREEMTAIRERMVASHEEMVAETKTEMEIKTMACQEMEAHQEKESLPHWIGNLRR
jgi:hypothetical protein